MSALFAINQAQEEELFDEIMFAVREKKISIIEHWLDDGCKIVGGLGNNVKSFKQNHELNKVKSRRALAEDTSEKINIRGTGHS
jgi:hypothetical protein